MKKIPISKPFLDKKDQNILLNTFNSTWISSNGKNIKKFEYDFSKYTGSKYSLTCTNGTSAIELALKSLKIKKNDEVIVPNLTFAATINAIINVGAKPIIVDVEKNSFSYNKIELKKKLSKKTFAVIFVHLFGFPIDIKKIFHNSFSKKKIFIIEDCAESLGTFLRKNHIGNFGDCSTFSFFSNKIITTGEGGMVNFRNKLNYNLALKIKNQGRATNKYYWHDEIGGNYRMTNLQASIGITQLKKIKKLLNMRKKIFQNYDKFLENKRIVPIHKIIACNFNDISYWYYTLRINDFDLKRRDKLINFLKNLGIESRPMFYPLSDMPVYKKYLEGSAYNSKYWSYSSISLPTFPGLKTDEIYYISKKINLFLKQN